MDGWPAPSIVIKLRTKTHLERSFVWGLLTDHHINVCRVFRLSSSLTLLAERRPLDMLQRGGALLTHDETMDIVGETDERTD